MKNFKRKRQQQQQQQRERRDGKKPLPHDGLPQTDPRRQGRGVGSLWTHCTGCDFIFKGFLFFSETVRVQTFFKYVWTFCTSVKTAVRDLLQVAHFVLLEFQEFHATISIRKSRGAAIDHKEFVCVSARRSCQKMSK